MPRGLLVSALLASGLVLACSGGADTPPINEEVSSPAGFEDTQGPPIASDAADDDAGPSDDATGGGDDATGGDDPDVDDTGGDDEDATGGDDPDADDTGDDPDTDDDATGGDTTGDDVDDDTDDPPLGPVAAPGELVITELMPDPSMLLDANAEWIELHNTTDGELDLAACTLHDAGGDLFELADAGAPLLMPAGATWVLAASNDPTVNGELVPDVVYEGFVLSNIEDEVRLSCGGELIDEVAYDADTWPLEVGHAISLDGALEVDATLNDDPASWCAAPDAYTVSNFGSPGQPNPECPEIDLEVDACRLIAPLDVTVILDDASVDALADVYDEGLTDANPWVDTIPDLLAEAGYGPVGSDPADDPDGLWTWSVAGGLEGWDDSAGEAGWDRYVFGLPTDTLGAWDVAFRFSLDGGASWLHCDIDGSDNGYDPLFAGGLTVIEDPCVGVDDPCTTPPEPTCDGDVARWWLSPGECGLDGTEAVCLYEEVSEDCSLLAGTCLDGACVDTAGPPAEGELVFTEIMQNPSAVGDSDGEWLELFSLAAEPVVLDGCVLSSAGNDTDVTFEPELPLLVYPGEYLLLAREADPAENGGIEAAYSFKGVALGNSDDFVALTCGETLIDEVAWDGGPDFPDPSGAAMQLDPTAIDAAANDLAESWCEAVDPYGAGDLGTPGTANPPCPAPDPCEDIVCANPPAPSCAEGWATTWEAIGTCTGGTCTYEVAVTTNCAADGLLCAAGACVSDPCVPNPCDAPPAPTCDGDVSVGWAAIGVCSPDGDSGADCAYAEKPLDCVQFGGTCDAGACVGVAEAPLPGQVVIAEVMVDPEEVGDDEGEWIELLNVSDVVVDLAGCRVADDQDDDHLIATAGPLLLLPGEVAVLASGPTPEVNGGITPDYHYGGTINLANGEDELTLICDDATIDAIAWDLETWPIKPGASIQLDDQSLDATANDDPGAWCRSFEPYGAGDLGTPGVVNPPCPEPNPVDHCRLELPAAALTIVGGEVSFAGYLGEAGLTDVTTMTDPHPLILAEVGFGPATTHPIDDAIAWSFYDAAPDMTWDGAGTADAANDRYEGIFAAPTVGTWDVAMRVSVDGGISWTACDTDGSENGWAHEAAGGLGVDASPCDPNPCDEPPADTCDGDVLTDWADLGACTIAGLTALCDYSSVEVDCAALGGACEAGACVGTAASPLSADLVVTEVMIDPDATNDGAGEWVELLNVTDAPLLLDGCTIGDFSAGDAHLIAPATPLLVGAGQRVVLGRSQDPTENGGVSVDYVYGNALVLANDADAVVLECGDQTIDVVAWEAGWPLATGAALQLDPGATAADLNDDPAAWCLAYLPYGDGDTGTPGLENPPCPTPEPVEFCRLQWPPTLEEDVGEVVAVYGRLYHEGFTDLTDATDPHPLVLRELGYGPDGSDPTVDDSAWTMVSALVNPEWTAPVDSGEDEYMALLSVPAPGTYDYAFRFSVDGGLSWTWCDLDAGEGSDGSEDGYQVANAGDLVSTTGPCDPNPCTDAPEPVCESDTILLFFEVPGLCIEQELEPGYYCDQPPILLDCGALGGTCQDGACVDTAVLPEVGELVFTELMRDTAAVVDSKGEWLELENVSDVKLNLQGCVLRDDDNDTHTIDAGGPLIIGPGEHVVLARSGDVADNGGVVADYVYSNVTMANGDDEIALECDGLLIDWIDLVESAFPIQAGAAIQLSADSIDAGLNDSGLYWCKATEPYGDGDLGTPGAPNAVCEDIPVIEPIDWCRLQWPLEIVDEPGTSHTVYGQVFEAGVTDLTGATDPDAALLAQLAWGPDGTDPTADPTGWSYVDAEPNPSWDDAIEPGNDEYEATLVVPGEGVWDYAYRFSADGGLTWTWCDLDAGVGGQDGAEDGYQAANAGHLEGVVDDPCDDEALDCVVPDAGDVVVTEVMFNPDLAFDSDGEWIELTNTTDATVTLAGCTLASANDEPVTIPALPIGPQAAVVLARSGDEAVNGGITPDWVYGEDVVLAQAGDGVELACDGVVIDAMAYGDGWPSAPGFSLSLDPTAIDAEQNDDPGAWCLAATTFGAGDLGTPGAPNDPCPPANDVDWCRLQWPLSIDGVAGEVVELYGLVHEAGITDVSTGTDEHPWLWAAAGYGPVGTDPSVDDSAWITVPAPPNAAWDDAAEPGNDEYMATITLPGAGEHLYAFRFSADQGQTWTWCDLDTGVEGEDGAENGFQPENAGTMVTVSGGPAGTGALIITEILKDPAAVDDSDGEWIEVYNPGPDPLDLSGCTLRDDDSDSHTIDAAAGLVLEAGTYAVLARSGDTQTNGGVTADYVYSGFSLANGTDEVAIECGEDTLDHVQYTDAAFPDTAGVAMQLSLTAYDVDANNSGTAWCVATIPFGAGDLGTPGEDNGVCP